MKKFVCNECGYRFESETEQTNKKCPYCGSMKIIKEPSAEDLLKDD
jgi:DNA-directed RNA polymerase subunit RPC12/RpoP